MSGHEERQESWDRDERYRQLVEFAPDGILVHDDGTIVLANAAALHLAGATQPMQLVGQGIERFLDPPYLKAVQFQITDPISRSGPAPPVRDTFRRLDGSTLEVEVRAIAFMDHGEPSAHLVIRDISERLAAEHAAREMTHRLQQAQHMESVGALAGGVAHEVNNMLQVVLGFGDFLTRDSRLPSECLADVREIMRAAEHAATVTRQLLAFGRRAVHRPRLADLAAAVREAEPVLRQLLGEGRRLVVETPVAPHAWVDPGQLEQVLINLALNARDAMPDGGVLTVTASEEELSPGTLAADGFAIPPGRYAILRVHDSGPGIDEDIRARIFEPFFTTKPVGRGTGLGLSASQGVLTQNHGFMGLTSAPGEGATFTVYLPVHAAAPVMAGPERQPLPEATGPTGGITVLLVDDEPAVRKMVARILENGGYRVLQAEDGAAALERIGREGPPQLVISDLMMPGINGAELARRLKESWPTLPILFMSGYSVEELQRHGAAGSEALIQKPFTSAGLLAGAAAALARAPMAAPPTGERGGD